MYHNMKLSDKKWKKSHVLNAEAKTRNLKNHGLCTTQKPTQKPR